MFKGRPIRGVLLDITGVLVESSATGDGAAIRGSIEAVNNMKAAGIQIRFVTNETQKTRKALVEKLHRLGYSMEEHHVFPPALAMASLIRSLQLRPFLLVHANCLPDLEPAAASVSGDNTQSSNAVILGDAVDGFTYDNLNQAFRVLADNPSAQFFSLGKGKFYAEDGQLTLDVGPFTCALEFATGRKAVVVGKPAGEFFDAALQDMGLDAGQVVMVGDDIVSDVGGAQQCGMQGVLVRTGKFRPGDESHPDVKPDAIVDRLEIFAQTLLAENKN